MSPWSPLHCFALVCRRARKYSIRFVLAHRHAPFAWSLSLVWAHLRRLARYSPSFQVLIPINNNVDTEKAGGTHWSLLCYTRLISESCAEITNASIRNALADSAAEHVDFKGNRGMFLHLDSSNGLNLAIARALLKSARYLVGSPPLHGSVPCHLLPQP
jgi:hypothetical protein